MYTNLLVTAHEFISQKKFAMNCTQPRKFRLEDEYVNTQIQQLSGNPMFFCGIWIWIMSVLYQVLNVLLMLSFSSEFHWDLLNIGFFFSYHDYSNYV